MLVYCPWMEQLVITVVLFKLFFFFFFLNSMPSSSRMRGSCLISTSLLLLSSRQTSVRKFSFNNTLTVSLSLNTKQTMTINKLDKPYKGANLSVSRSEYGE